jgi:hypothetical protein
MNHFAPRFPQLNDTNGKFKPTTLPALLLQASGYNFMHAPCIAFCVNYCGSRTCAGTVASAQRIVSQVLPHCLAQLHANDTLDALKIPHNALFSQKSSEIELGFVLKHLTIRINCLMFVLMNFDISCYLEIILRGN